MEEAFRTLKGDLAVRPIHHQEQGRIEAHIFIAFLAYCLHVTLGRRLKTLAPGLTSRSAFEKFAAIQMIDVHIPTADARELQLTRTTQPEPELTLLLRRLKLELPDQPPPKSPPPTPPPHSSCSADLSGVASTVSKPCFPRPAQSANFGSPRRSRARGDNVPLPRQPGSCDAGEAPDC